MLQFRYVCAAFVALAMIAIFEIDSRGEAPRPLTSAHAHNDYLHKRPLLDALDHGFCSVEADIFVVDGELLVGHTRFDLSAQRTFRSLYLEPLRDRIRANKGSVYGDGQPLTLLIDIKTDGEATYRELDRQLTQYQEIFSCVQDGQVRKGAVIAIVSGDRPVDLIAADTTRYVGIDGRLADLESDQPAHLLPLISDNWRSHFQWRGVGPMPEDDRAKLDRVIKQAHAKQRRVRFWATPDRPELWAAMKKAQVDLINTDDLAGLSKFLRQARPQPAISK